MKLKQNIYFILMPVVRLYWRIFKPQSYGVKVVVTHPQDKSKVLLVRHSYGDTALWNIPGGGYNPKKETAESAIQREVLEELGVSILNLQILDEYHTDGEGKKDTVRIFSGTVEVVGDIKPNPEISQFDWVESHTVSARGNDVARVARRAIEKLCIAQS